MLNSVHIEDLFPALSGTLRRLRGSFRTWRANAVQFLLPNSFQLPLKTWSAGHIRVFYNLCTSHMMSKLKLLKKVVQFLQEDCCRLTCIAHPRSILLTEAVSYGIRCVEDTSISLAAHLIDTSCPHKKPADTAPTLCTPDNCTRHTRPRQHLPA